MLFLFSIECFGLSNRAVEGGWFRICKRVVTVNRCTAKTVIPTGRIVVYIWAANDFVQNVSDSGRDVGFISSRIGPNAFGCRSKGND